MVKISIGNATTRIIGTLPEEVHKDLDSILSHSPKNAHHIKSVKEGRWDGIFHLYQKTYGQSFPTGLLSFVTRILEKHNIEFIKEDGRARPIENLPHLTFTPFDGYQKRDYQQFTIDRAYSKTRGLLKMATGAGKTLAVAELIGRIKTGPFMFYVLTQDLMDQAYEALSSTLNEPIGMIGGGQFDVQKINVCTIQTAVRAVNLKNRKFKISDYRFDEEDIWDKTEFLKEDKLEILRKLIHQTKGLYVDECHHVSSRSIQDVLNASPSAFWRYGGTATPYREDGAEILIQASFGKKIVDISASYLIEKGFLLEPYIIFEPIFHSCPFDSYQKIYPYCVSKNPDFNSHVADQANFLIENGQSVLVLVQHIQHGKELQKLINGSFLVTSKLTKKNRKETIQKMRDGEIKCMIGTSLADEGLDIPVIDAVLMAGGGASSTRVHQRIGRALRINKLRKNAKALIIYYHHHEKYLDKHAKKAMKIMKTEPKFNIIKSKGKDVILNEISEVMGFEYKQKTIFNL